MYFHKAAFLQFFHNFPLCCTFRNVYYRRLSSLNPHFFTKPLHIYLQLYLSAAFPTHAGLNRSKPHKERVAERNAFFLFSKYIPHPNMETFRILHRHKKTAALIKYRSFSLLSKPSKGKAISSFEYKASAVGGGASNHGDTCKCICCVWKCLRWMTWISTVSVRGVTLLYWDKWSFY